MIVRALKESTNLLIRIDLACALSSTIAPAAIAVLVLAVSERRAAATSIAVLIPFAGGGSWASVSAAEKWGELNASLAKRKRDAKHKFLNMYDFGTWQIESSLKRFYESF
jgi:hypothetical protein